MRTRLGQIGVICAMLSTTVPAVQAEPATPQVRAEIIALTQQLMDAIPVGNRAVWQRIAADDALIVDEFGRRQTKQEIVDGLRQFPAGFSGSIQIREPKVHVYGDTAVIVCEEYEQETVFGQKLVVRYIANNTFVRRDGAWKVVAMEDVTLPTPPPKLDVPNLSMQDYPGVYRYGPNRAWAVTLHDGVLAYTTRSGRPSTELDPIAKDVFMEGGDEKNLLIFRRNASGHVFELIERRKFNDLKLKRDGTSN